MSITPKFVNNNGSNFHQELKKRVQAYFTENNLQPTGNISLYFKAILLWCSYILLYVHVLFFTPSTLIALTECLLMGGLTAAIGFNVMHDACHGSFSKNETLNTIMGYTLNILGGNSYIWKQKHNIIHHTYTNVDGVDDDIAKSPVIRQCYTQKWVPAHKVQHLYLPLI